MNDSTQTMLVDPKELRLLAQDLEPLASKIMALLSDSPHVGNNGAMAFLGSMMVALAKFCAQDSEIDKVLALYAYETFWMDQFKEYGDSVKSVAAALAMLGIDPDKVREVVEQYRQEMKQR